MEVWKNPQLYKSLGEIAYSLGGGGGPYETAGARLGKFGMEESQNWAAREAREKAEKEKKKAKKWGWAKAVAKPVVNIGATALGVPWAGPLAAEGVDAAMTEASGGEYDLGQGLVNAGTSYLGQAIGGLGGEGNEVPLGSKQDAFNSMSDAGKVAQQGGEYGTAAYNKAVTGFPETSLKNAAQVEKMTTTAPYNSGMYTDAVKNQAAEASKGVMQKTAEANAIPSATNINGVTKVATEQPMTKGEQALGKILGQEKAALAQGAIDEQYGGWKGLAASVAKDAAASEKPLSAYMKPYPGLSEEGYRSMLKDQTEMESAQAMNKYREAALGMDQARFGMDQARFGLDLRKANAPVYRDELDTSTGIIYDVGRSPFTGEVVSRSPKDFKSLTQDFTLSPGQERQSYNQFTGETDILGIGPPKYPEPKLGMSPSGMGYMLSYDEETGGPSVAFNDPIPGYRPPTTYRPPNPQLQRWIEKQPDGSLIERQGWYTPGQEVPQNTATENEIAAARATGGESPAEKMQLTYSQAVTEADRVMQTELLWDIPDPFNSIQDTLKAMQDGSIPKEYALTSVGKTYALSEYQIAAANPEGQRVPLKVIVAPDLNFPDKKIWSVLFSDGSYQNVKYGEDAPMPELVGKYAQAFVNPRPTLGK